MKQVSVVVSKVIEILGSLWLVFPADSSEVKLNLTGRSATQSSAALDPINGPLVASHAIDGNYNTIAAAGFCSHTNDYAGGTSWWRVDLGQPIKVQRVVIVNRSDCCGYRLDNFVVGLTNSSTVPIRGSYALCGQYPGPTPGGAYLSLSCDPLAASGRYVIVQQSSTGDGYLTICEIEIYAGQERIQNRWKRLMNRRVVSVGAAILRTRSALECVGKCQQTAECDSVNYHQLDNTCEMNFLPPGATGSQAVIEGGWDNWAQIYEFI